MSRPCALLVKRQSFIVVNVSDIILGESVSKTCNPLAQVKELYFHYFLAFIPEFNSYITA